MRLTFIQFNPLHETKDRIRQLLLKTTAKRHEKEYSCVGERLYSANLAEGAMILTLAERAYGVNIGEQVYKAMNQDQVNKVANLCRKAYLGKL